jgi:hypothetical protein
MERRSPIAFMTLPAVCAAAALSLVSLTSSADTPSPFLGTWVLNVAKSTFVPPPPLKSNVITVTQAPGGGVHTVLDIVEADGTSLHLEYTTALDGKAVPVTGYPAADSVRVTKVSARTFKDALLKDGKVVERGTFTVSKDGKTLRGPLSGTEGDVHWKYHYVFDHQ